MRLTKTVDACLFSWTLLQAGCYNGDAVMMHAVTDNAVMDAVIVPMTLCWNKTEETWNSVSLESGQWIKVFTLPKDVNQLVVQLR